MGLRRAIREWANSTANFFWFAFRAAPKVVNDVWGFVVAIALLVGAGALGNAVSGWPQGFVFLGGVLVLLAIVAGVRLQHTRDLAEQVRIDVEEPFLLNLEQGWQQLIVRIANQGPASRFRAFVSSDVSGIDMSRYGTGTVLAWEGTADVDLWLGHGATGTLRVARSYAKGAKPVASMSFIIPPSPDTYSSYGEGLPHPTTRRTIEFDITITDVDRDVSNTKRVRWVFDEFGMSTDSDVRFVTKLAGA